MPSQILLVLYLLTLVNHKCKRHLAQAYTYEVIYFNRSVILALVISFTNRWF